MAKLIIRTGFQAITHDIAFQPQTTIKAKQLVLAQHVQNVQEIKCGDHMSHTIEAHVIRQTSVTSTPYKTSLYIDSSRYVTSVKCDCVYNKSGRCKHIAALIYYINHEESFSKTSEEQQWGRPSARQFAKEKYSKGKYFEEMYPPAKKIKSDPLPLDILELKGQSALKLIMEASALGFNMEENHACITKVVKNLVDQVEINLQIEDCIECLKNFCIFKEEFEVYKSYEIEINQSLKQYYEENIIMKDEKIVDLCCKTIEQSKCKEWYTARRLRISSSMNVHDVKDSLVNNMLFPKSIDCEAMKYGKHNESYALQQYQKIYNCRVIKVGVIVSKLQPWLCTSIDGVVIHDGCVRKLVEFKCPISCQKKAIFDSNFCNVQYLEFVSGNIELKKKHSYYTQVQIQMYVTGMTMCDLFVYSPVENGSCTVRVDRDEQFIKDAILKSEEFYFKQYLPHLFVAISNEETNKNNNKQILPKRSFTGKDIINI